VVYGLIDRDSEAGFRRQRAHPFAADGIHVYVWLDGDRYSGPARIRRNRH
jgi:hypothetical protein